VVEPVASQHHQVIHRVSARLLVVGGDVGGVEVLRTGMGAFVKDPRLHLPMVAYATQPRWLWPDDAHPRSIGTGPDAREGLQPLPKEMPGMPGREVGQLAELLEAEVLIERKRLEVVGIELDRVAAVLRGTVLDRCH